MLQIAFGHSQQCTTPRIIILMGGKEVQGLIHHGGVGFTLSWFTVNWSSPAFS